MARRLIRVALVSGDTAMPATEDVAANIYRWERGTVTPVRAVPAPLLPRLGHPA